MLNRGLAGLNHDDPRSAKTLRLVEVVAKVEHTLAGYYRFDPMINATDHLIYSKCSESPSKRGEVLIAYENGEAFIGINFREDIVEALEFSDPLNQLNNANIDAFCVVVEEISHAHLIANRASTDLQVSMLELEWQAEIDKLLVCGLILDHQYGRANVVPLARKLYDVSRVETKNETEGALYETASRWAARFWWERLRPLSHPDRVIRCQTTRDLLCEAYENPWTSKMEMVSSARQRKAS